MLKSEHQGLSWTEIGRTIHGRGVEGSTYDAALEL